MDNSERPIYTIITSEKGKKAFNEACDKYYEEYLNSRSFVVYPEPEPELELKLNNAAIKLNEKLNQKINS